MKLIAIGALLVTFSAATGFTVVSAQATATMQSQTTDSPELKSAKSTESATRSNKKKTKEKRKDKVTSQTNNSDAGPKQANGNDAQELAKQLANPIASLISVPTQINYDRDMGPRREGSRITTNIQPVVPFPINKKWNLISRTILPVIHQEGVTGPGEHQTGIGDIVQSLFFSPNKTTPFIWGAGPVLLLPTASKDQLGSKQFGIGPTIVALKQQGGWTYGALYNHIWGVAGGSGRPKVNSDFIQPFIAYGTKSAWTFTLNTESSYDWNSKKWSVPIHLTASKLIRVGTQPVSLQGGLRCWATSPEGGPQGCGPRVSIVLLFPVKR